MILDSNADSIPTKDGSKRTVYTPPKIMKRGGYHNQSSLDHTKNYPPVPDPTEQHPLSLPPPLAEGPHLQQHSPPLVVKLAGDEYLKREMLE